MARSGPFGPRRLIGSPIFVVGLGRSGTTVLLQALGRHPRILAIWSESPFIHLVGGLVSDIEAGAHSQYIQRTMNVSLEYLHARLRVLCFESVFGARRGLRPSWRRMAKLLPTPFRVTHWATRTYPDEKQYRGVRRLYPEARFLYVIRNGCEVVESRSRYETFRDRAFIDHCKAWTESIVKYAYLEGEDRALVIRHEDLVLDPEQTLRRCFLFVGLGDSERPAAFLQSTIVHPLDTETRERVDVRRVFEDRPPAYATWTEEQRTIFKRECGKGMTRLGYEMVL